MGGGPIAASVRIRDHLGEPSAIISVVGAVTTKPRYSNLRDLRAGIVLLLASASASVVAPPLVFAQTSTHPGWRQCGPPLVIPVKPLSPLSGIDETDRETVNVEADRADVDEGKTTTLTGNVVIQRGPVQLAADQVIYNQVSEVIDASGTVRLWDKDLFAHGTSAHLELATDEAKLEQVTVTVVDAHGRGTAERAHIIGEKSVKIDNGTYTTCNPGNEDWILEADSLDLDREENVGAGRNVLVKFKGVPIFYSPFVTFPLGDERKSGFLPAKARVSSSTGVELTVPYYFNLAPNRDATLGVRAMQRRGVQVQGEYRYLISRGSGEAQLEYLHQDRERDEDRTAAKLRHSGQLAPRWHANVDLNWVSDNNYFEDLGTNLAVSSQTYLERRGDLIYTGDQWWMLGRIHAYQTVDETIPSNAEPYKRLPQILASTNFRERNRRINYGAVTELVNFDRDDSVTGRRGDLTPWASYPMRSAPGFIIPKVSLRFTQYDLDGTAAGADQSPSRLLPTASLDGGLFFERDTQLGNRRLVHTLEPRAYYLAVPFDDQTDLPVFDSGLYTFSFAQLFRENRFAGTDRVGDAHQLTLAITSRLLTADSGGELLRASVGQIRYLRDRKVTIPGITSDTTRGSNLVAEVAASLAPSWRFSAGAQWDPRESRTDRNTVSIRYKPNRRSVFNAAYRFLREDPFSVGRSLEQADFSMAWPVSVNLRAVGRWNYALAEGTTLESFAGLEYESCCWAFRTVLRRHLSSGSGNHTSSVFLQLELKGLTGIGRRTVSFIERSIPGYENEF